ncbi:MAG: glycerophosphodiester phosphodiesterase, partial [Ralstonia sp.]|nr:glycerophosphodiester phosphodiesterase [Ralstonia sp.]
AAAREAVPELPRALLLDKLPADWLDRLRALDCVALDANHRELTPEIIDQAHAAGFRVCCYTVNDLDRAHLLWSAGLDGLITDWVDRISPA